jgi:hypothetical protein
MLANFEILDNHQKYWDTTASKTTTTALSNTRRFVILLVGVSLSILIFNKSKVSLQAIRSPHETRLETTCKAIYGRDLKQMIRAIRAPVAKEGDPANAKMRENAKRDRQTLRRLLTDIVITLLEMCDVASGRASLEQYKSWFAAKRSELEEMNVEEELNAPPEHMYT